MLRVSEMNTLCAVDARSRFPVFTGDLLREVAIRT